MYLGNKFENIDTGYTLSVVLTNSLCTLSTEATLVASVIRF